MTDIEQVRAALEEIGKLIDLIDCTDKHNLALLPLFLVQQKRALAALPLIQANALEAAAKVVETKQFSHYSGVTPYIAAAIRALKAQP